MDAVVAVDGVSAIPINAEKTRILNFYDMRQHEYPQTRRLLSINLENGAQIKRIHADGTTFLRVYLPRDADGYGFEFEHAQTGWGSNDLRFIKPDDTRIVLTAWERHGKLEQLVGLPQIVQTYVARFVHAADVRNKPEIERKIAETPLFAALEPSK
ncbi:MAG: hypothetical protein WAZ18_02460 [Alphaproteobacteria bacterium]